MRNFPSAPTTLVILIATCGLAVAKPKAKVSTPTKAVESQRLKQDKSRDDDDDHDEVVRNEIENEQKQIRPLLLKKQVALDAVNADKTLSAIEKKRAVKRINREYTKAAGAVIHQGIERRHAARRPDTKPKEQTK